MPDMVETYAGVGAAPWWAGSSPTAKSMVVLEGEYVDLDKLQVEAGLDWRVGKQPAFVTGTHAGRIPGWNAIQRETDGSIFGLVKDTYHLFQNDQGFAFAQSVLGEQPAQGLTAGSLYGGALVWLLLKLDKTIWVKGDDSPLADYLLLNWGHDGRHGLFVGDTMVRVVCGNTNTAAIAGAREKVTIRHTPGMGARIEEVRHALDIHTKYVDTLEAVLNDLARRPMTIDDVKAFTTVLLPANPEVERAFRTEAERDSIVSLFANSTNMLDMPLTAYRAYQAVTEYLDHGKTVRGSKTATAEDRRAVAIIEGPAYNLKANALRLLVTA